MRQVNRDELHYNLAAAMRHVTPALRKALVDRRTEPRQQAEALVAGIMVKALASYEVMVDAPPASAATFARPLARMLGEDIPDLPMVEAP